jgi:AraC family transcriptional regulator
MKSETRTFYEAAVERAVVRIVGSLDEALDLEALSRDAALSPFHFHRVFRGLVGETPLELHRRLRLERAATQLVEGNDAVTAIAFDAGYETHEAFTRAFRQAYGLSPSAFRQRRAELLVACVYPLPIELAARCGVHFGARVEPSTIRFIERVTGETAMDVAIEERPELRVAAVHHTGSYQRISEAFGRLGAIAGPAKLIQGPDASMLGIFHDDPETTPVDQLRSEAGLVVSNDAQLPAGLEEIRIPAGRYARTTHLGPYTGLGDTWSRLMGEWLPRSGHRVGAGPSYEIYRNTPADVPANELRTELYLPVE